MIIFLDLETTGLDHRNDLILEIAAAAVDEQFNPVSGCAAVIHRAIGTMPIDPFVRDMHTRNGLWAECAASAETLVDATDRFIAWLDSLPKSTDRGLHTLAGDSVHFDLAFLRVSMPRISDRFSHRLLDVSAFGVARRALGMPECDIRGGAHRAQSDVLASIAKAKWHLSRLVA